MPRRICCSLCGQEGHNRRNRYCEVNRHTVVMNECLRRFDQAVEETMHLEAHIVDLERNPTNAGFIEVARRLYLISSHIRATSFAREAQVIQLEGFFVELIRVTTCFNNILRTRTDADFYIRLTLTPTGEILISKAPIYRPAPLKLGASYLKELSLVRDLTISDEDPPTECPICFDSVAPEEVVYTNCKHAYCGTCIKSLATSVKDTTKKPCCPMCRCDLIELKMKSFEIYNEMNDHICNL